MRTRGFASAILASTMLVVVVTSCRLNAGRAKVDVTCQGIGPGINCTVAYKSGPSPVTVCWRVNIFCKNGPPATAEACERVEPRREVSKFIPLGDVKNLEECDLQGRNTVDHLVISPSS
jgi:hypothetical protein